ncbi:MAG: PEP-CTERM sorting domain-containing protein [Verrucomicrobia bacterium]|nr:PEP-CTERM sorting domain-containing protein [Verrucomicrobiota bacterium]MCH8526172.1 PEP-CTERM sorting domain-containing protein [Kiritimatiellia bacterium]
MHCTKTSLLTALTLGFTAASLHAAPMSLASFGFSDAPVIETNTTTAMNEGVVLTSTAETVGPGISAATFSVVRDSTTNQSQSGIANVAGSSNVGAAQISGQTNNTYAWETAGLNYFQFTLDFDGKTASEIDLALGSLVLNGRTAVEWTNTGVLGTYNSGRGSSITLRSSLDNFAANIGSEVTPAFSNTNNDWVTTTIDLSSLNVLLGTQESVTFRIYTRTNTPTQTGNNLFNRTQLNSVELTGVAIPEPGTLALVGIALGSLLLFRRRK